MSLGEVYMAMWCGVVDRYEGWYRGLEGGSLGSWAPKPGSYGCTLISEGSLSCSSPTLVSIITSSELFFFGQIPVELCALEQHTHLSSTSLRKGRAILCLEKFSAWLARPMKSADITLACGE